MIKLTSLEDIESCSGYQDYCAKLEMFVINECPLCHLRVSPIFVGEAEGLYKYVLLECPDCNELFIAKYSMQKGKYLYGEYEYTLQSIYPQNAKEAYIPEKVNEISPMFVEIYNQSSTAESCNLNQVSGIGYRKSLEFLIKDYLKYKLPEKTEEIEKKFLGKCIDLIENQNIQKMAKGATWIGNDETHYIRKWENKDINDLKKLISLTLTWIDLELKTAEYALDMNL